MTFESLSLTSEKRIASNQNCNTHSCSCDTCPFNKYCKGPSKTCDAKYCTTRSGVESGCLSCRAVCNKASNKNTIIENITDPDYSNILWSPFEESFPDVIYQINSLVYNRFQPFYIINSKKLTYLDTYNWSPSKNLKYRFKIPHKSKVIISFFTNDNWMDNYATDLKKLAKEIKKFNPDYVFCPDFSVYSNYPRFDILSNLKRRFLAMEYLQNEGVKVIPILGWIREEDLDICLNWALKNKIKYGVINLQTVALPAHNPAWKNKLAELKKIKETLKDTELFLIGSSAEGRLESILKEVGKFKLIDTKAFRLAEYKKDYLGNKQTKKTLDIFEDNMKYLNNLYKDILHG